MLTTREVLSSLVDLVVPRVCALCGAWNVVVCETCDGVIRQRGGARRRLAVPGGFVEVRSAVVASPEILRLVTAFKDGGRTELAGYLSGVLRAVSSAGGHPATTTGAAASGDGDDVVVTVPQSRRAYRRRGWNPVRTVARAAGFRLHDVLDIQARHIDQTTLTRDARWHNVSQTIRVRHERAHEIRGRSVTIVDDVITTGATMSEVARALTVAGARSVRGVTIVSVERLSRQTYR